MTPARTGGTKGRYELDRVFPDVGRVRRSSGTHNLREFHRRDAVLTKLYETAQLDVLRAFQAGRLTIEQLIEHDRHGRGGETLELLRLRAPLWATVDATLPLMGGTRSTRERYAHSFKQLRARAGNVLGARATVEDVGRVSWGAIQRTWPGGPADWNRLRAAVSRFLSLVTGDKYSPFRRATIAAFPRATEPASRTPDLTPAQFVALLAHVDEADRAAYLCLVLTGARVGEYLQLDKAALQPGNGRIRIGTAEGNKTGARTIVVPPEFWGWVVAAVPYAGIPVPAVRQPVERDARYRRLQKAWKTALRAEGLSDVRIHDLRHCTGQWASDAGVSDGAIQQLLGHADPAMTGKYTKMAQAGTASAAVGRVLTLARKGA